MTRRYHIEPARKTFVYRWRSCSIAGHLPVWTGTEPNDFRVHLSAEQLAEVEQLNEEREAFMVRWHGDNRAP